MVSFDKAFKPSIEQQIESYENLIKLHKNNIGQCCTCLNHVSTLLNLPGYVIDYGECKLSNPIFSRKVNRFDDVACSDYKEETVRLKSWMDELNRLKNSRAE